MSSSIRRDPGRRRTPPQKSRTLAPINGKIWSNCGSVFR